MVTLEYNLCCCMLIITDFTEKLVHSRCDVKDRSDMGERPGFLNQDNFVQNTCFTYEDTKDIILDPSLVVKIKFK